MAYYSQPEWAKQCGERIPEKDRRSLWFQDLFELLLSCEKRTAELYVLLPFNPEDKLRSGFIHSVW
ncbi:hypothetical protein CYD30_21415 [Kosakonia cowanii]|nr:hypothetical protein CYD30_21415 [Kosakonia cowanii]